MADEAGSKVQQLIAEKFATQKTLEKAPLQVGKLDQSQIDKFENTRKELEEENENLQIENNNFKENLKKLKTERATYLEKIESLNKQLLNAPAPAPTIAPLPVPTPGMSSQRESELNASIQKLNAEIAELKTKQSQH